MFRSLMVWAIAISAPLLALSPLQERIDRASNGDYLVVEGGKMITLLSIRSVSPATLILEEISVPTQNLKKRPVSWSEWVREKAPGHTSWSMLEVDRSTGEILECYSFTRSSWIQLSSQDSLIATLLSLPLEPVPIQNRRKIGPSPSSGEIDTRKIWSPPIIFEGKKREGGRFDVYEATWPKDKSPLSGNTLILYFDQEGKFPLPVWIQVETTHANLALRTIDAGNHFPSPYRKFPRRIPQFIGEPEKYKNGLRLSLKSPKYFRHFDLFAIDVTTKEKELSPITYLLNEKEEDLLTLEIPEDELNQVLKIDHRYTWLLVPTGHTDSYTETTRPFTWEP